jgi:hypothetical protein
MHLAELLPAATKGYASDHASGAERQVIVELYFSEGLGVPSDLQPS